MSEDFKPTPAMTAGEHAAIASQFAAAATSDAAPRWQRRRLVAESQAHSLAALALRGTESPARGLQDLFAVLGEQFPGLMEEMKRQGGESA